MHEAGFAHKDIKVENLHFGTCADGSSVLKLLDFGMAMQLHGERLVCLCAILPAHLLPTFHV